MFVSPTSAFTISIKFLTCQSLSIFIRHRGGCRPNSSAKRTLNRTLNTTFTHLGCACMRCAIVYLRYPLIGINWDLFQGFIRPTPICLSLVGILYHGTGNERRASAASPGGSDSAWRLMVDCWDQDPARRPAMSMVAGAVSVYCVDTPPFAYFFC